MSADHSTAEAPSARTGGRVAGKVAFISGAARGQGRAHALRLAGEGADIIAFDACGPISSQGAPPASKDDLDETVRGVEALDRRIVAGVADTRDFDAVAGVLREGLDLLGHVDIVAANAGIQGIASTTAEASEQDWRAVLDTNLTGVWNTARAAVPHMVARGEGGAILLTSSSLALKAVGNFGAYTSAKHGVVGLMRTLAVELAPHRIRVNSIHPTTVPTPLLLNENNWRIFRPDLEHPVLADVIDLYRGLNLLPVPWVEPEDVANALLFLASEEARYVTGVAFPVDAGMSVK
ncbi:MAG TPA: mycofactocin-coupled SDR family oxidoreductase [Pseudonocardia sp.]|jgi:SDR family mycofactocin-dependent oxidoreductase|nr:mycofactocin-coupled SDR family oxidoreductase [Pseudonocardia sp.]